MSKAKYWVAIMYPEGMIDDWEDCIARKLQVPGVYCKHDKDLDNDADARKEHVHIMIKWGNNTTQRAAKNCFMELAKEGCQPIACGGEIQAVHNVRNMYNYLIHDTEECHKKNKYQYDKSERIEFNGWDIGIFEQVDTEEKKAIRRELCQIICDEEFTNFAVFYKWLIAEGYDGIYREVAESNSGILERLTRGNYQTKWQKMEAERLQEQEERLREQEERLKEIIRNSQPTKAEKILENYGKESEVEENES